MRFFHVKESCRFTAMIVFFGLAGILSQALIPVSNTLDFILVQMLTLVSCLGLFAAVVAWVLRIRDRKSRNAACTPE